MALNKAGILLPFTIMLFLSACGSGGGSSKSSSNNDTPAPLTGTLNIKATDGAATEYDHVWVTLTGAAINSNANAVWSQADSSWQSLTLATPITIDLAALENGNLSDVLATFTLPVGSYKQIRLFLAGSEDQLTSSAQATATNQSSALKWNNQIEFTDSSGVIHEAPLEFPYPSQGVRIQGAFTVSSVNILNVGIDFDLEKELIPYQLGSSTAFTFNGDQINYFDLSGTGGIVGQLDASQLCPVDNRNVPTSTTSCAYDIQAKAELVSADGKRHYSALSTRVNPKTGAFTLYPLNQLDSSQNALFYDVVIQGKQMETIIATDVQPTVGTNPTNLQLTPISLNLLSTEYQAQLSSPASPLTEGHSVFQQTVSSGGLPYEIKWVNTDPFTGLFNTPVTLEIGTVQVGKFPNFEGALLPQQAITPIEGGNDFYSVALNAGHLFNWSSNTVINQSTPNFNPPSYSITGNLVSGTASFNLTYENLGQYDNAFLIISDVGSILSAMDISSTLASGSTSVSISHLPAGTSTLHAANAFYYAYFAVWDSTALTPQNTWKTIPITQLVDLRNNGQITISQLLDGNSVPKGL